MNHLKCVSTTEQFAILAFGQKFDRCALSRDRLLEFHSSRLFINCDGLNLNEIMKIQNEVKDISISRILVSRDAEIAEIMSIPKGQPSLKLAVLKEAETKALIRETYDLEIKDRMPFLSVEEKESTVKALTTDILNEETFALMKDQKVVSLTILRNFMFGEEKVKLIAWIWIDKELDLTSRIECHSLIDGWVKKNSLEKVIASIHFENQRSINLFNRWGYKPAFIGINL